MGHIESLSANKDISKSVSEDIIQDNKIISDLNVDDIKKNIPPIQGGSKGWNLSNYLLFNYK